MDPIIILQGISVDQLLFKIDAAIEKKLNEKLEHIKVTPPVKYLTRREVADQLHISLPTLHNWTKMGWLKSYRIGSRILFRSDELESSLQKRNFSYRLWGLLLKVSITCFIQS